MSQSVMCLHRVCVLWIGLSSIPETTCCFLLVPINSCCTSSLVILSISSSYRTFDHDGYAQNQEPQGNLSFKTKSHNCYFPFIRQIIGSMNYYCLLLFNIPVNVLTINTETDHLKKKLVHAKLRIKWAQSLSLYVNYHSSVYRIDSLHVNNYFKIVNLSSTVLSFSVILKYTKVYNLSRSVLILLFNSVYKICSCIQ